MASKWRVNAECVHNIKRQWTILYLDVRHKPKQSTSPGTTRLQPISTGAFVKIMMSRLQTNDTRISQKILIKLRAENRPDSVNSTCKTD